jgi:Maltogenic Amylase, C-terminal domain
VGRVPLELWGNIAFPRIGELPYLLTLGPHNFLWFQLVLADQIPRAMGAATPPGGVAASGGEGGK